LARTKSVRFAYESVSLAGTVPTGVACSTWTPRQIPDMSETSSGLLGELGKPASRVGVAAGRRRGGRRPSDNQVIAALSSGLPRPGGRAIFGPPASRNRARGQTIIIQVSGTVKVVS